MLSEEQRKMLTGRLRQTRAGTAPGLVRRPAGLREIPLSFAQEQLWFLDRFTPGLATYNVPLAVRITGPLDLAALRGALNALVARHEALRTRLVSGPDGRPVQVVDAQGRLDLDVVEVSGPEGVAGLAQAEAMRPFVLAEGPLFRTKLIRIGAEEHVLIVVVHHAVFDGWSIGVMVGELAALYQSKELPELPVQFADSALWERERLQGPALEELLAYWRTALNDFPTLEFPTDRPRPAVVGHSGGIERLALGSEVLAGLRDLARKEGTTLFVTLLAALTVLLQRYTGQDDIVVGTVSANRDRAKLAPIIGFLVNTLAIRTDLAGDPTFTELIGRVREATVGAYGHQGLPFAKLVEALHVERDPSRAPVFQVALSVIEPIADASTGEVTLKVEPVDLFAAKFDLNFFAEVSDEELQLGLSYATALFDAATIRRLLGHFRILLAGVVKDPGQRLSELPILTEAELHRERVEWNDTAVDLPLRCVHEGFERQVARTPDGVAAELDGETVTYAQLNADANRIARRLRELEVGRETLVGVSMAISLRRLAVLLGIMKAGGGYVPLDPALPADRLAYMISDAAMPVIVADDSGEAGLPEATGARLLPLDREWPEISARDAGNPGYDVEVTDLAYVIYTSGSTGRPKGVMLEHRNVSSFLTVMIDEWRIGPADRILQYASLSFDCSVMDIFMALQSGARVVLTAADTRHSPPRLAQLMRDAKVTFACLTASVLRLLNGEDFPDLRILFTAGEELPTELAREWIGSGFRFVNEYGPTEATIGIVTAELDGTTFPPPIGRPKDNCQAYVLDGHMNPVPVGVVGELHLGGMQVARGYLNAPALTATRFVPDPFSDRPGARLYKSGDLVRRLPSGEIVYVGRIDGQIKIRGLRVELGEIEAGLVAHPAVAQAVAVAAAGRSGERELVAYVRPEPYGPEVSVADLRRHLADRLPASMVPTHLLVVESFPLSPSGKIDKRALPAVDAPEPVGYVAPRTETETELARIYARLLGLDQVGIDDGFFDLGGNSLQAMQLIAQIHRELATDISVTTIFLAPSVRRLAARIEQRAGAVGDGLLVELSEDDRGIPLFVVHAVGGTVHAYAPLAAALAESFRVYGVEAPGISAASEPAESLTAMVTAYIEAIRAEQPTGPYRLAGWSMGGVLAFEIAQRLEHEGERVALLGLLDAPFDMSGRKADSEAELAAEFVADAARTLGWDDLELSTSASAGEWLGLMAERLGTGSDDLDAVRGQIQRRFEVFKRNVRAIAGYRPTGTVGADTLIVSARRSPNAPHAPRWAAILEGRASTVSLDDDHYSFLRQPSVEEVSTAIRKMSHVS